MNPSRPSVKSVFDAALEIESPQEREAFLARIAAEDVDLHRKVEALLLAYFNAGSFLEAPAVARTIDMPAVPDAAGTVIGPYKLLQQIGEGGMGTVYMAEQAAPVRRKVALKIIKPGMDTHEVIARFEAERQALALMDHSNIARVFEAGATDAGRPYFVMELVRGVPLTDYCDQNNLPVHERLELFITVCHAVQHAHQKGIIHRDIKPSNVLVTMHDGRAVPKVIDFGVAKAIGSACGGLTDKTLFTQFAQMVGTPLYMSPEQAQLTGLDVDTRGDIYSLGVMLYELLTGTTPFERGRMKQAAADEIRRMMRDEDPPSPSARLSSTAGETQTAVAAHRRVDPRGLSRMVRGDLDWIVMKALEKDRNRRYETANGFAADIVRYLSNEPVQACPPSSAYRFRKFARRNRVAISTAALVLAALVTGTVVTSVAYFREVGHRIAMAARMKEVDDAHKIAQQRLFRSLVDQARANHLSRRIGQRFKSLDVLTEAARMAREMSLPEDEFLELRSEAIACLALADVRMDAGWEGYRSGSLAVVFDGALKRYARSDQDGNVSVRRVADDHELWKLTGMGPGESWPVLSADGEYLWLYSYRGYKLWNLAGQEPAIILEGPSTYASFSPDSHQFATAERSGTITLFDLPSASQVKQFQTGVPIYQCAWHPQHPQLAIGCPTGVRIVDLTTGTQLAHLQQAEAVEFVTWHPDGKMLAAVGSDVIQIWDVPSGKSIAQLKGFSQGGGIKCTFSHAGDLLASTGWEGKLRLWDPRTGEQLFQYPNGMMSLHFSPDDQRLAAAAPGNGRLAFVEVAPVGNYYRTLIRDPVHGPAAYQAPAISRDGRLLAVGMMDGLGLWDLATGKPLEFLPGPPTYSVAFEPSGALLASGAAGLARWPINVDAPVPGTVRIGPEQKLPFSGSSIRIGMSRDGGVVGQAMGWGGLVWQRDLPDSPIRLAPHHDSRYLDVSPDGRWVATGAHNGTKVKIWDASTGECVRELALEGASHVVFSPDGRWLLTTYEGDRLWAVDSWEEVRKVGAGCTSGAFSPDGKLLALGERAGVVRLVNPETGQEYARLEDPHQDRAFLMCFSPDGSQLVAIANDSHAVHVWNLRAIRRQLSDMGIDWGLPPYPPADASGEAVSLTAVASDAAAIPRTVSAHPLPESRRFALRTLPGHTGEVWGMAFSPDGTVLASSSADSTVRLWEAQTGRLKYELTGHTKFVRWVAFSPDGSTLASGSFDGTVRLWDPATGAQQGILNDTAAVYPFAFTKDGNTLVTGSSDKSPRMWNVTERTLIRHLEGHSSTTWAVALSHEANLIATGGHDPVIKIWSAADGSLVRTFDGHPTLTNSLGFSPDGHVLAAPGRNQAVKLWDPATGELLREIPLRHIGQTVDLAFAPGGKSLATACDDRCTRLWDVASGKLIATYAGGGLCVAFSPDGKHLAGGGADKLVFIWDVPAALKADPQAEADLPFTSRTLGTKMKPIFQ